MVYAMIKGPSMKSLTWHHKKDNFNESEVKFKSFTSEVDPCNAVIHGYATVNNKRTLRRLLEGVKHRVRSKGANLKPKRQQV